MGEQCRGKDGGEGGLAVNGVVGIVGVFFCGGVGAINQRMK